ncbi:MAG: lysylphosphatidylglycerol synthase transmembrane domain-containing protein, partial [Endomicrobiia bacterium]
MKKWIKFFIGILISGTAIYLIFKHIDLNEVYKTIKSANIFYLILTMVIGILLLFLRSFRWKMLIKEYSDYGLMNFFASTTVGLTINNILPFRAGDLAQAYSLSKKIGLPKSLTFSTVLMERFIDFFPPIIFIIIGSFFVVLPKEMSLPLAVVVLSGLIFSMVLLIKFKNKMLGLLEKFSLKHKIFLKLYNVVKNFYIGIENFKDIKLLLKTVPITFLLWAGYSITAYLCCLSLGITLPSLWASFLVQAIIVLSVLVPSSPGYIGTWEAMSIFALKIFGIEESLGFTFGLIFHA